jgi:hypothetical protein
LKHRIGRHIENHSILLLQEIELNNISLIKLCRLSTVTAALRQL